MIKLVLADDHRLMQDGLKSRLEREDNLEILSCVGTGADALKATLTLKPDVLLLDINMPNMNGIEMIREVRSNRSLDGIPIVLLTTESQKEKMVEGKKAGAAGWMVKTSRCRTPRPAARSRSRSRTPVRTTSCWATSTLMPMPSVPRQPEPTN